MGIKLIYFDKRYINIAMIQTIETCQFEVHSFDEKEVKQKEGDEFDIKIYPTQAQVELDYYQEIFDTESKRDERLKELLAELETKITIEIPPTPPLTLGEIKQMVREGLKTMRENKDV